MAKAPTENQKVAPRHRFGAHMSIAGGLHMAFERAAAVGCDVMQIFVKNQRQWRARPLDEEAILQWQAARELSTIDTVIAHDAYLINLAAPQEVIWKTSIDAFLDELTRCCQVGITGLVTHPGSHNGDGEANGLRRVARSLGIIYDRIGRCDVSTLLEVTAGQGTNLGYRFEHLAEIMAAAPKGVPVGVCLDTCHLFAAGYDISSDEGYQAMVNELEVTVGLGSVRCIHMNDSKRPLSSRVDRHEHIGKGEIGRRAFARIVNDRRFIGIPMILETPKEKDARGRDMDRVNLALLRKLAGTPGKGESSRAG